MSIKPPAFNEASYHTNMSDEKSTVTLIPNAGEAQFCDYIALFKNNGYTEKECYTNGTHRFSALEKDAESIFINYFGGADELYILTEQDSRYFGFEDKPMENCVKPQITQLHLEDFGMSYIIRLSDGRFIVIDGGRWYEADTDRLYSELCKQSPHEKPVITAWILTHCHSDHFNAFITFAEKYKNDTVIEKVLYNFPCKDDIERYPALAKADPRFDRDNSPRYNIPLVFDAARSVGAELITARTGQIYKIGDAVLEILASMDDTIHRASNINATSLVIRMELGGQVILWTADMTISDARLNEKYGDYLKCDIMQVPHHGFMSGDPKVLIEFYNIAKPSVCLLPVSGYTGYSSFSTYMEATDFLMRNAGVDEMIDGDVTRTLMLPYTAAPNGKKALELTYLRGRDDCGARTWVFMDMCADNEDDCKFTVLNMTAVSAVLHITVCCEDGSMNINHIKAVISSGTVKKINIFSLDDVDGDAELANSKSLKKQGKPEGTNFSVRIRSSVPVVVSNKNHKADYHSINR